jgi:hypothetical protein
MKKQTATGQLKEYKVPAIVGGIEVTPAKPGIITETRLSTDYASGWFREV